MRESRDYPPGHKSNFHPFVTTSPMGAYEVKLAYFGCHFGCQFLRPVLKLFLNPWGDGLVLTHDFNLSLLLKLGV